MKRSQNHPFRVERQKRNMSLQDVADATNLGWTTIWRAEQGHELRPESRRILCEFFQIGPTELGLLPAEEGVTDQSQSNDEQSPLYMLTEQQLITFAALC